VTLKIPRGGHSVIAGVTAATLTLIGAAAVTTMLETPLTQALAAEPNGGSRTILRHSHHAKPGAARSDAGLARGACDRWLANHSTAIEPNDGPDAALMDEPSLDRWALKSASASLAARSSGRASTPRFADLPADLPARLAQDSTLDPHVIFSDQRCRVDELVVSRDWVVARLSVRGGLPGVTVSRAADGDKAATDGMDLAAVEVMHLTNGQIDEDWRLAADR
jgi:hypothetical protein